jgi:tRNA threonylcarbamoyladenosine biosynthesis protein TsaE
MLKNCKRWQETDMAEFFSTSEQETEELGRRLAETLKGGAVVAMYGDLGAGKTAFVRGMARGLGLDCRVSSPTFTIVNEYLGERELIHFDLYRISGEEELFDIGWEDYLSRGAICAVEWSENVPGAFYGDEITVRIRKTGDTRREIEIGGVELC